MKTKLLILTILLLLTAKTVSAATIKINEFYAAGSTTSNPDWVEIYYSGVDITLYQLKDAAGNTKNLSGGSYNGNFATVDWSNRLNNDGDTIKLALIITPDSPIDQVTYGGSGDISVPNSQQSAGRSTDGTGGWVLFSIPTKGYTNNTSLPTPTPTITPTPSPTPTPSSAPKLTSSFTISN
ncbi:hypothetical protein HYU94_00375, partial [Candidatus Daviesbacteria bacterium]|nr:hypothetical protein [Candidatus Daviesbacteria bacterium]